MSSQREPHVGIVIPVYNAEDTLERCVRSVLNQTYQNFSLIIVDNVSTDASAVIGQRLACSDRRVRLVRCDEHLPMLENWNRALALLPEDAVYVKQLNVDDALFPGFLASLVHAFEQHPRAVLATSFFKYGHRRVPRLPHDDTVCLPGRSAAKRSFFGHTAYLVHPSAMLIRRDAVADPARFYWPTAFPADSDLGAISAMADVNAFLPVAARGDVLFVAETLSEVAERRGSTTGSLQSRGGFHPSRLDAILRYGEQFLSAAEQQQALRRSARRYLRSLVWRTLTLQTLRDPDFRRYQSTVLRALLPALEGRLSWEYLLLGYFSKWLSSDRSQGDATRDQLQS